MNILYGIYSFFLDTSSKGIKRSDYSVIYVKLKREGERNYNVIYVKPMRRKKNGSDRK